MAIEKVVLVGANGKLGPWILNALLAANEFKVTVLSRKSSKSKYPESISIAHVSDDFPNEELVEVLRGNDAVVVAFAGSGSDVQIRLADAAAQSGIKTFIPADFGSCDSSSPRALELIQLYTEKKVVREHLQQLSTKTNMSWTSIVCGHFFDYGLQSGLLSFDLQQRKARRFDDGKVKWSTTTLATIAMAVIRVLQKTQETKNRMLYIQSFCVSQNQILTSLEIATSEKWNVEEVDSNDFIRRRKDSAMKDENDAEAIEDLVSVVGIIDSNWEVNGRLDNSLLDLQEENLDGVIIKVLQDTPVG